MCCACCAVPCAVLRAVSGRDLVNMAKQRPNVIPIIEDARHPQKYRMLVPMVDVIFADVAQPDQVRPGFCGRDQGGLHGLTDALWHHTKLKFFRCCL